MGTRSRIAIHNGPGLGGSFASIYVHWDGYPEGVGATLLEHYKDEDKIRQLIALGDLSSLGAEIGSKHDFNNSPDDECNAYGRDRGETDVETKHSANLVSLSHRTQDCGGEYLYVYENGQWYVGKGSVSAFGLPASKAPGELRLLSEVLAENEVENAEGDE